MTRVLVSPAEMWSWLRFLSRYLKVEAVQGSPDKAVYIELV